MHDGGTTQVTFLKFGIEPDILFAFYAVLFLEPNSIFAVVRTSSVCLGRLREFFSTGETTERQEDDWRQLLSFFHDSSRDCSIDLRERRFLVFLHIVNS